MKSKTTIDDLLSVVKSMTGTQLYQLRKEAERMKTQSARQSLGEMSPEEIRNLRKSLGLRHAELAAKVFVTENAVYQWESGRRTPRGPVCALLKQLAAAKKPVPA